MARLDIVPPEAVMHVGDRESLIEC